MMKYLAFILILLFLTSVQGGDLRLRSMGGRNLTVPDIESGIDLYKRAGNTAWMQNSDSLNWMRYYVGSENDWGPLRRDWDARRNTFNFLTFSGQKRIHDNQMFYGRISYNWDYRYDLNRAIEKNPYASDPFVLADSVEGNTNYLGPEVYIAYNHRIGSRFYWGLSVYYNINRGLKEQFTRPEIISREINARLDVAYNVTSHITVGASFRPYQNQDITKLVTQPDGSYPETIRYRGEFEFRKSVASSDRTALYEGFEAGPQLALQTDRFRAVWQFNYYYQWHELFDGSISHNYDGYYQNERYHTGLTARYEAGSTRQIVLGVDYQFHYQEDWAREPDFELMFYQSEQRIHDATVGISYRFDGSGILLAGEYQQNRQLPDKRDYLAHKYRSGDITDQQMRIGSEFNIDQPWRFRAGFVYQWYREADVWNYFGDFSGPAFSAGFGYYGSLWQLEFVTAYGTQYRKNSTGQQYLIRRQQLNSLVRVQYFF